jgi:hypothetical protein
MSAAMGIGARAALVVATATCGCLAVTALALAFADLAMNRPRVALVVWERTGAMGDYHDRRRLLARIGQAVAVNPLDADQRMDLGRFFVWHAERHHAASERARFYRELAASRFEEAVRARPTWGFAWMLMAEQWWRLDRRSDEVLAAMRRGAALGPNEPGVQLKHLWLGMGQWTRLDSADRDAVTRTLTRLLASRVYFHAAARIAVQHGRADLVRGLLREDWQRRDFARVAAQGGV